MSMQRKSLLYIMSLGALLVVTLTILATTGQTVGTPGLNVTACAADAVAASGNRAKAYLIVSVTEDSGLPVKDLTAANFKVYPSVVGPGGALLDITAVTSGGLPGVYNLNLVPFKTETWKKGTYVLAVSVQTGTSQGQALSSMLVD